MQEESGIMIAIKGRSPLHSAPRRTPCLRASVLLWMLATALSCCWAAVVPIAPSPTNPVLSIDQMRNDIEIIRESLREGDPGLYRFASRSVVENQFAIAINRLNHARTTLEFYRIV